MSLCKNDTITGVLFATAGFSLFAMGDAVFKYLGPVYSVYVISFYSSLFALIGLLLYAMKTGGIKKALQTRNMKLHLLRGLLLLFEFLFIIYAFTHMTLAKTYALIFAAPLLTTIFSIPLLGERVNWRSWLVIAVGFIGVLVILRPGLIPLDLAAFAALGGALLFCFANIAARKIGQEDGSIVSFGLYVELVVVPGTLLLALTDFAAPTLPHLGLFVFSGFSGGAALILIALGFAKAPAAIAAPFHYVQMIWGIALGYIIFGDALDLWTAIGATLIIGSGLWLIRMENNKNIPDLAGY